MLGNKEMMAAMMKNNPMIEQMKKANPEIGDALEDPAVLEQMMEVMKDPVKMEEMLRQQDQMLTNLQNMPGGAKAFDKLSRDLQGLDLPGQNQKTDEWFLPDKKQTTQPPKQEIPKDEKTDPLPISYLQHIGL